MPKFPYRVLDVFTDRPLTGNPLGLFPDAGALDGETMQAIASELNLSETIFITGRDAGMLRVIVRIFTPGAEIPFAGHPSIGCAWHLFREGYAADELIELSMAGGLVRAKLDASFDPPLVSITPPPVTLGLALDDAELVAQLYGIDPSDLAGEIGPAQVVAVGLRYLQAPLRSRAALERCRPDVSLLAQMESQYGFNHLSAFTLEGYSRGAAAAVRMFAPMVGVYEDPATGSNAACLTAYLHARGIIGDSDEWVRLDQGYSLQRPSALFVKANPSPAGIDVRVGGQCVEVLQGELTL